MTTTTLGKYLLAETLPEEYRPKGEWKKKDVYKSLSAFAKANPGGYAKAAERTKRIGDYVSTMDGLSVGLADIAPQKGRRDPIVNKTMVKLRAAKTDDAKRDIINGAQDEMMGLVADHPSDLSLMARSGGRGNASQLMRMLASPAAATDSKGETIPWLVQRSYSEGLTSDELWVSAKEARQNAIQSKESVQEPGAFGKVLLANMSDQVVTSEDCGADNGLRMSTTDPQTIDRVLAKPAGRHPAGTIITAATVRDLRAAKVETVEARTPLTCEAHTGLCAMCYGADEWGKLPETGRNVGVRSAQAMSEPLVQFALNAKHGVRTADGGTASQDVRGLKGLKNFLDFPQSFTERAVLSKKTGTVESVEPAPQGGHYVTVAGERHYLRPKTPPKVTRGQRIEAGDALSKGMPTPEDVVRLKDFGAGRLHVAETVHDIYKTEGATLDRRHTELLAKSHLDYVRVIDDPDGDLLPGEVVRYSSVKGKYGVEYEEVDVEETVGRTLAQNVGPYTAGTRITPQIQRAMVGYKQGQPVRVYTGSFKTLPVVKGVTRTPLLDNRWMRKLGHRYLRKSITESAAAGETSDIHGTDPIAAYAYASEFGDGSGYRY